jgi:hypothetical protein
MIGIVLKEALHYKVCPLLGKPKSTSQARNNYPVAAFESG